MKTNVAKSESRIETHEGGRAARITPEQELRRTVMSCLLWEENFYESGEAVAVRIADLVARVDPAKVAAIAIEARGPMNLRHVPLKLCRELAAHGKLRADTLAMVIQRADEMAEFLAIYWKDGKRPLSAQVKKGLALAFPKFSEYALAKYNRDAAIKLRDVLFLCHAKPKDDEQTAVWKRLIDGTLAAPDTWEVALSAGADKKATWERLIREQKLGALALLRNLRNMQLAAVDRALISEAIATADVSRVLPFRFIAAARHAVWAEPKLEDAMRRSIGTARLEGETVLLVDVSGSMNDPLSDKSDMRRLDAACGLAMILREIADVEVWTFSNLLVQVPARRGFALRDAITQSQPHQGTALAGALAGLKKGQRAPLARLIVISDEQAKDDVQEMPEAKLSYMLNVGTSKNGVGYGRRWTHLDGFSEAVVRWMIEYERSQS